MYVLVFHTTQHLLSGHSNFNIRTIVHQRNKLVKCKYYNHTCYILHPYCGHPKHQLDQTSNHIVLFFWGIYAHIWITVTAWYHTTWHYHIEVTFRVSRCNNSNHFVCPHLSEFINWLSYKLSLFIYPVFVPAIPDRLDTRYVCIWVVQIGWSSLTNRIMKGW